MRRKLRGTTKAIALVVVSGLLVVACRPGSGPESIPLPTSPDTTTTTSTTTSTTTTTTTTTVPPTFEATIRTTTDGIPHIEGRDRADISFGQGYVSGETYGCTLLDQILKVTGERSLYLGPGANGENVDSDFAWRALDLIGRAEVDFPASSDAVIEQFEAFTTGWNQYLADEGGRDLPGWCTGAEWVRPIDPIEVYAYARSIALLASGANFTDYIATAQPPDPDDPAVDAQPDAPAVEPDFSLLVPTGIGSNAWAIGADRIEGGTGSALVANPHLPWEGALRYAEVQLTVPGDVDIYGVQLAGLPGIATGYTSGVAWSHTASAGHRYTLYTLDLDPASPTTYLIDGEPHEMTSSEHAVEILRPDGTIDTETRRLYESEYGPIINFPNVAWTNETVLSYRDANLDNDEAIEFSTDLLDVEDLAELQETDARHQGIAQSNTVAVGADGDVWYADTSATPKLSAEAELLYAQDRFLGQSFARTAFEEGVILLDGSDSRFRWEEVEGARDPGLVPYDEQPQTERRDYVFNANDSFWVPNDRFRITGDYSVLHGQQDAPLSMRTRQNAMVLAEDDPLDLAGPDDDFSAEELRDAAFDNTAQTAALLREPVVAACRAAAPVPVDAVLLDDDSEALPAETVDLTPACDVLDEWDGRFNLDSAGAVLWRETMTRFADQDFTTVGPLFSEPFDPADPTETPAGFTTDPTPVVQALARAVQTITQAGFEVDATMGAAQFTERSGERIPLHGGTSHDGVTNVVGWSDLANSSEPAPTRGELVTPNGDLRGDGYPVNDGTSFVMVVDFSSGEPDASAILTYGNTGHRESDIFASQTVRFSEKNWRQILDTDAEIDADPNLTEVTVTQP
ncbi:penicillin acylase family protein [Ilumatobacter sp.]|uniref:penicillin acylase family protein n=1 Tax=Ilumatobacter sp. TaxID=1967498 RepID=UPI003C4EE70E